MIQKAIPVLPTYNINETIMFYKGILGFDGVNQGTFTILKKDGAELLFNLCADKKQCENIQCCIKVSDIQCLYSEIAARGIIYPENKLIDLPGGKKSFTLKDNNGILLLFIQEK